MNLNGYWKSIDSMVLDDVSVIEAISNHNVLKWNASAGLELSVILIEVDSALNRTENEPVMLPN